MRGVLRKWTPRDKYFKYQKFPDTLSLPLFLECFCENLTKIDQIYVPNRFARSGCIPSKIQCEILVHKDSQTTRATPKDYLAS